MTEARAIPPSTLTRVASGIPGLDTILRGGFMQGGIYIIQGAPGAGKTILSNQICFHHIRERGGCALYVTLLAENHARMMQHLRGVSFFDEALVPDKLTYLSAFREMREGGLKALTDLLRREIQRRRCTMAVVDGLVSARATAASEMAFKEFIHDLQEVALATDCTMFLTANLQHREQSPSPAETMVDGLIELNDRIYGWRAESDLQVVKFRGSGFLRGRHGYKISDSGLIVHPRIEALLAHPSRQDTGGVERRSSGVADLDRMLGGGLPTASTTMIMGPSGSGKTTLGLHFLARSSPNEPGLLFGFYETPARLDAKVNAICKPLRPLIDGGSVAVLWQPPTDDMLDAYGERLLEAVHRRGVKRLVIDGLTSFHKAAVEPSRLDHFFTALANELRVLGVTTLYTLEVPDILGPAIRIPINDISSLAENLILLRFIELRAQLYRLISILKVRDSDFDPSLHEFTIKPDGLIVHPTDESAEAIMSNFAPRAQDLSPATPPAPQGHGG
jgi:circadian clock protein KaiC